MSSHSAVASVAIRAPLAIIQVPTVEPEGREVLVRVQWTASTPLDLHQNDGGLLVTHPKILGDVIAGTVVRVGTETQHLQAGDRVFGFSFGDVKKSAYQELATVPETSLGKIPDQFTFQEAATLPDNTVTVFHAVTEDLSLPLPWPCPPTPTHSYGNTPILIWGGASSCGQYALQILSHWGYNNLISISSSRHHEYLRGMGARHTFDYHDNNVAASVLEAARKDTGEAFVPYIIDCIGSRSGSLVPLASIAKSSTRVAVLLPVIVKDATENEAPIYAMDVQTAASWAEGVEPRGVRTHFYAKNEFFREHLQPEIVPALLAEGIVRPNRFRIVQGDTLLERAQAALDILRRKEVSAQRLVWRVSEE